MSINKQINAQTSTFPSSKGGNKGNRAPITYYGSITKIPNESSSRIKFNIDDEYYYVPANNIEPKQYDYIVFSNKNKIYLLYITSRIPAGDSYTYPVNVDIIDTWITYEKNKINTEDYSDTIKVNYFNKKIKYKKISEDLFDGHLYTTSTEASMSNQGLYRFGEHVADDVINSTEWLSYNDAEICLAFQVYTKNLNPIGNYKITMEFNTDWQSPAVDTMIVSKFALPEEYAIDTSNNFRKRFVGYDGNGNPIMGNPGFTQSAIKVGETGELLTFRGYLSNYTLGYRDTDIDGNIINGCITENFDDEKLDNFEIIIKNYEDGIGTTMYNSDVFIPGIVLLNAWAKNNNYKYRCNLYLYIENTNGTIDKAFLGDFTDDIYDELRKAYERNERTIYKNIQQKSSYVDDETDEIIINEETGLIDDLPGKSGGEGSGTGTGGGSGGSSGGSGGIFGGEGLSGNHSDDVLISPGGKVIKT